MAGFAGVIAMLCFALESRPETKFKEDAMRNFMRSLAGIVLSGLVATANALPIADSIADFSSTQGGAGWSYGYFNAGAAPGASYTTGAFVAFDTYSVVDNRWEASAAQVGAANNVYLSINANGGHPNGIGPDAQDSIIWAIRRYTSAFAGAVDVDYLLRKANISNANAGGITGHLFVDGVELLDQFIANADGVGVQGTFSVLLNVGSVIDFAIDPEGLATSRDPSVFSARADGTDVSAVIRAGTIPEPGVALLLLAALPAFRARRRMRAPT